MSTTSKLPSAGISRSSATKEQRTTDAKRAFLETLASASATVDSELKERASNIHTNAQALNKQREALDKENDDAAKETEETSRWIAAHHKKLTVFDDLIKQEQHITDLHEELDDLEAMLDSLENKSSGRGD